jgi:transcriptional regulator with PAS, ATPase and Fis domain
MKGLLLDQDKNLLEENRRLRSQIQKTYSFDNIIGISKPMRSIFAKIADVAETDANVLIQGEKGVGKEFIARSLHANSLRKEGSFILVNCVDLPSTILEKELFGYAKGAFGASTQPKQGLLKHAHQGTVYLNEICDLDLSLQEKLVDVLKKRYYIPMGGTEKVHVDLRIISSTRHNPEKAMLNDTLHENFYYRLNAVSIIIPPLRDRKEDLPLLANHFLEKYCTRSNKDTMKLSTEAISCLMSYTWPGNVNELQTLIERLVSLNNKAVVRLKDLPKELQETYELHNEILTANLPLKDARKKWVAKFEKTYLLNLLAKCNGNISKVARVAKVNRMTIYRMINYYNITFNKSYFNRN